MADRYLLESGAPDGYLLEDASGVLLLDAPLLPYVEFYAELDAAGGANPLLNVTSVSWAAGDRLYVMVSGKDDDAVVNTITATGLTFTQVLAQDEVTQQQVYSELWESGLAAGSGTQTVAIQMTSVAHVGGLMASVLVVSGTSPTTDASAGAETGATDTTTPSVDVTTVAAATRLFYGFQTRNQTLTLDGADALTSIRATDFVGTAGNIAGFTLATKTVSSQGTYNGSGTITATDWVVIGWAVKEGSSGTTVTPGVAALVLTAFAPTVTASDHKLVTPGVASLTLTTFAPTIGHRLTPGVAALVLTAFAPTVAVSNNQSVTPGKASLTLTGFAPSLAVSDNKLVTPGVASLSLTGFAPQIRLTVTPGVAALVLSAFAPTVTATAHQTVTPGTASLTLTPFAPTVTGGAGTTVTPGTASLTLTAFAPSVVLTDHKLVTPGTAALALTAFAPNVVASDHKLVTPATASLVLTRFAPTVSIGGGSVTVTPGTASLVLTAFAPSVNQPVVVGGPGPTAYAFVPTTAAASAVNPKPSGAAAAPRPSGAAANPKPSGAAVLIAPEVAD